MELVNKETLKIKIDNYSGPLEVLLDLARSQKVDLANISISQLADQFIEFINSVKKINLDLASEYLLMATWLAYLKSKLLLPEDKEDDFKVSEVAEKLKLQLKKLELIRLLSDQLLRKKRLGVDVYTRGMTGGIRSSTNSDKFFHSDSFFMLFFIISIPCSVVHTGSFGIFMDKKFFFII